MRASIVAFILSFAALHVLGQGVAKFQQAPNASNIIGTVGVASGGTGATTLTQNGVLYGNGTSAVGATPAMGNGGLVIGTGVGVAPSTGVLTGTSNQVMVTNAAGKITLSVPQNIDTSATVTFGTAVLNGNQITYGTATIYGNAFSVGTSTLSIASGQVGIGTTTPSANLSVRMGTGTATTQVGGLTFVTSTSSNTPATTNETDLYTYTLPPNSLAINGQVIKFSVWGFTANNADSKTLKLYFGGTAECSPALTANSGATFLTDFTAIRNSATNIVYRCLTVHGTVTTTSNSNDSGVNSNAANIIKITGTNGAGNASDIVVNGGTIEYYGQ